ncbi:RagB/SusD family nutrient uptake outer membrane protein [Pedobacter psychroterrae]|uniref:RagB/SusD family nutrient uptake outer membrane protein n=1 Tax=Pedobacter psychroterrae TaxID=2530453 RepID=A0A4R0ND09_9SPHI|nr:RagB/SusD family nutrient uptake outer membrane protein [Pedobacter psychroterrae]TCC98145.1 RagB/SusD family nutrient uptake outer membrane protein [Pedobacter psychroterrae]
MKTNKIYHNILAIACCLAVLMFPGCKKGFFDTVPDNLTKVEDIFANRGQTENWLAGLYSLVPDPWNLGNFGNIYMITTDEADASNWNTPALTSGAMSPSTTPSRFAAYYERIRAATIFLERIEGNQEILTLVNGTELIKQYKGEARFLRAYYYWLMMKEVGPVVIMPLKSMAPEDDFQIPRSSWDESVAFVLGEIAIAKEDLPLNNFAVGSADLDIAQTGRINKIIATAVESQILLYHASPLYNGNAEFSDFKNLDGKVLINPAYDATRWKKAADASKAAIDLAESQNKALYKFNDADPFRAAFLSTRNLYWDGWKTEGIWMRTASGTSGWEISVAPRSTQGTAYNGIGVVQSLVDDFRMADGLPITGHPGYNENTYNKPATVYYVAGTNTMYTGREARFYVDITFNGSVSPSVAKTGANNARVEFFNTGTSGKSGAPRDWPKTGYVVRKNLHPTYSASPAVNVSRPAMLIRLAELYLNYAEALNEAEPGNSDILKYLNAVRNRGGLPSLTLGSQEELRKEIRLERRIELCFEMGNRYFDVRRWKIADKPGSNQGGAFYGMNMDAGTSLSDPAYHKRIAAINRAPWQRRYYFMPYGQNEADRNKAMVQFPGY